VLGSLWLLFRGRSIGPHWSSFGVGSHGLPWPDPKQIEFAYVANVWQKVLYAHKRGSMDISVRQSGSATVVDVNGDITLRTTPDLRKVLLKLLHDKHTQRVIVSMDRVRYIDSAGVASLVEALRVSRDTRTGFALFGLNKNARQVLELTKLITIFEIHDNEEEALQAGHTPTP